MGDQSVMPLSSDSRQQFIRHLLCDIRALEQMIAQGMIEQNVARIGAEQELCLVGADMRPANCGPEVLAKLKEPNYTTELARWNLEINLDPQLLIPGCFAALDSQLRQLLAKAREQAAHHRSRLLLTGILPTIRMADLQFGNMTPNPRYRLLDSILRELRGEDFSLHIEGVDELNLHHESILFEACNTSFQVHLQIDPREFVDRYNWAQIIAGPVLAVCANSPLLLGRELWAESRIALFCQSVDTRHCSHYTQDEEPRVAFGRRWLESSAVDIFKRDVTHYPALVSADLGSDTSIDQLERGEVPKLKAMNLHNGTLYKWNRACYGISHGRPHLRIENRYLAAGPTIKDEMANAVFWVGLMLAMPKDLQQSLKCEVSFQDVRSNFLKAARYGLSNELTWFGKAYPAVNLIAEKLIPLAAEGLKSAGLNYEEFQPYLQLIEARALSRQTGAQWIIDSFRHLRQRHTIDESLLLICQAMSANCCSDDPVHQWRHPQASTLVEIADVCRRVECIMNTMVATVHVDDAIELAESIMQWNGLHHLPVIDCHGKVKGVISAKDIDRVRKQNGLEFRSGLIADCMTADVITVSPETTLEHAWRLLQANQINCLPVVCEGQIVGMVTARDFEGSAFIAGDSKSTNGG